jgi:hypothetical protein
MEFITQSPDAIFFGGVLGMFFLATIISVAAHKFFG